MSNTPFKLKEAIKADFQTVAEMEFDVIDAKAFYLPIIRFMCLTLITLTAITMMDKGLSYLIGTYKASYFIEDVPEWIVMLPFLTLVITFFINSYVQFLSFAKTRLITGPYFCKKINQMYLLFAVLYGVFVFIGTQLSFYDGHIVFESFIQMLSFFLAIFLSVTIAGKEAERLGLGVAVELIEGLLSKLKQPATINK